MLKKIKSIYNCIQTIVLVIVLFILAQFFSNLNFFIWLAVGVAVEQLLQVVYRLFFDKKSVRDDKEEG